MASMWTGSSGVGNSWPSPEALDSRAQSFKPISKWRILRIFFSCTRIWRDVGRQAENLRVRYTLDLQFRPIEVPNPPEPSAALDSTLVSVSDSFTDKQQQCDKPHRGVVLFPLVYFPPQPNSDERPQPVLAVVAFSAVFLSLECDQYYPPDHVDWGGDLGTSFLLGTLLGSKNTCVSIVTLFQAASILLFQAAYFWLKFREAASSSGRKRQLSDRLQGVGCSDDVHLSSWRGVYARPVKDRGGKVLYYKYEPRFKPPRERTGDGEVLIFQNLPLGSYSDPRDAQVVRHIAAFYYDKETEVVSLGEGRTYKIPATSHHGLSGHQKAKWVSDEAKKLFDLHCKPSEGPQPGNQPCTGTLQHSKLDNMVADQEGETTQPSRPVQDAAEELNTVPGIRKFLLGVSEDVAPGNQVELYQPEGFVGLARYRQLQPVFPNQAPPCNTSIHGECLPQFEPVGQWPSQSSEGGAATSSCKWDIDGFTSEGTSAPAKVAPSVLTDFCSKNCTADLLVKMVSRQWQQIEELKCEIERLKGLKCSFCCSQLY
jgi:hypothetical protein